MKLRIKGNSIRLRMTRSEVAKFLLDSRLEDEVSFGPGHRLIYRIEARHGTARLGAEYREDAVTVYVPESQARAWATGDDVGMQSEQVLSAGSTLRILVEKDFACLQPANGEDQTDAYPNPTAGNC